MSHTREPSPRSATRGRWYGRTRMLLLPPPAKLRRARVMNAADEDVSVVVVAFRVSMATFRQASPFKRRLALDPVSTPGITGACVGCTTVATVNGRRLANGPGGPARYHRSGRCLALGLGYSPDRARSTPKTLPPGDSKSLRDVLDRELLHIPQDQQCSIALLDRLHPATQFRALAEVIEQARPEALGEISIATRSPDSID